MLRFEEADARLHSDTNGQVTAVGTGDKTTYEHEAIAGSVGDLLWQPSADFNDDGDDGMLAADYDFC